MNTHLIQCHFSTDAEWVPWSVAFLGSACVFSSRIAVSVRGTPLHDRRMNLSTRTSGVVPLAVHVGQASARWSNESTVLTSFSFTAGFKRRQRQLQTEHSPPACSVKVADSGERACEQIT